MMTSGDLMETSPRPGLWRSRWAAIGAAVAVSVGAGGLFVAQAAPGPSESTIVTVTPERILDTRDPVNVGLPGPFVSAVAQKLQVTGSVPTTTGTKVVVPLGATGVLLNVTPVSPSADGFISIRPGDATGVAATSSLNFTKGAILPNSVQVGLPTSGPNAGKIDITYNAYGIAGPTTDILIDVVGYMTSSGLKQLVADVSPLFATIGPTGAVYGGISSGLVSSTRNSVGEFDLEFNRAVADCATATSDYIFAGTRDITADNRIAGANKVRVVVTDKTDARVDTHFSIIVQCPHSGAAPLIAGDAGTPSPNE